MNKQDALSMVNELIAEAKQADLKAAVNEVLTEIRAHHMAPLKKAIEDVQAELSKNELAKIDPKTGMPGNLIDKSENKWKSFVQKCSKTLAEPKMSKADTVRPDAGFGSVTVKAPAPAPTGKVIMKDDMPHPANSPEDKAHDIAEGQAPAKAISQLDPKTAETIKKMFNHLRSKKGASWNRSPENKEIGKSEEAEMSKEMSKDTKDLISAPTEPYEPGKPRPGQANEPSKV